MKQDNHPDHSYCPWNWNKTNKQKTNQGHRGPLQGIFAQPYKGHCASAGSVTKVTMYKRYYAWPTLLDLYKEARSY